jgi:glutathione S-transferase
VYLLAVDTITQDLHTRMAGAFEFFLEGIERALEHDACIAGEHITLADIAFACDLSQFLRERLMRSGLDAAALPLVSENAEQRFPRAFAHLVALIEKPHFARYLDTYTEHFRA